LQEVENGESLTSVSFGRRALRNKRDRAAEAAAAPTPGIK